MNDDLIDYLIATDSMDEFLGYEPKCPNCGNKLIPIEYGMPAPETFEKAEKGEVFLGGCMVEDIQPVYHCNTCRRNYYKNLKDYIDEENNWEDEDE